jgi:hypothetical protein
MRILLLLLSFLLQLTISNAQLLLSTENSKRQPIKRPGFQTMVPASLKTDFSVQGEKCGFNYVMNKARAKGFKDDVFESQLNEFIKRKRDQNRMAAIVTVPVIFHVIFRNGQAEGGTVNISQARINAQIQQLNEDYANLSGSAYGVAADVEIRFCAALVDPYGRTLAQPGIERINGQALGWTNTATLGDDAYVDYLDNTIKPSTIWDPNSYVNIWTATCGGLILGYATFPGFSTLGGLSNAETDLTAGVVVIPGSIGSETVPGTEAPYNLGRTLTHELGHFFGLRHIWGDSPCGNDFCNDTPVQDQETTGCPASPQPNNCVPALNKMFENYMDYSNDACLNTFTADQALRATTVLANSPRRVSLPASAACQARAANSIQFDFLTQTVSELVPSGICPRTKVINIAVGIAGAATGGATVTFNLGGTALNNSDYTISPASVTYTNGDNSLKQITITIIDDNTVESTETLQLSYTISGGGVVAGPDRQVFTLSITDDDFDRPVNNTTSTVTLLSENFNSTAAIPVGWTDFLFGTTNGWTVSANGGTGTAGNAAHVTEDLLTKPNTYDETLASDAYLVTPLIDASSLTNYYISVSFKWRCIGEIAAGENFDYGTIGFIPENDPTSVFFFNVVFNNQAGPDPAAQTFTANLPASFSNSRFWFVFNWTNDDNSGEDPGFTIDDVLIQAHTMTVESTLNDEATVSQNAGQSAQYVTPDRQIIARIDNLNENVGCITATIQNAGTGLTTLTTSAGSFMRSNKVIRLEPSNINTSATYQVTLYYTTAEMAAWGGNVPNLKMIKVNSGVNLAGVLTPADAQLVTPTVNDLRATQGYVAFTGSFTGGFSQFTVVSPTTILPVNLITFEARPSGRSVVLNWSTAQEINNKGFGIERSINGVDYKNIGWINGQVNSNSRSDYAYTDNYVQPGLTYHYRLRQTDIDNREKLSIIRQARIENAGVVISLNPNPAKGQAFLFISGSNNRANISLLNGQGQLVRSWQQVNASDLPFRLDIGGLVSGIYIVNIQLPEGNKVEKLLIE